MTFYSPVEELLPIFQLNDLCLLTAPVVTGYDPEKHQVWGFLHF